jgi:hypothetical protein
VQKKSQCDYGHPAPDRTTQLEGCLLLLRAEYDVTYDTAG